VATPVILVGEWLRITEFVCAKLYILSLRRYIGQVAVLLSAANVAGDAEIERRLALALEVGLDEIRVVGRRKEKPVVKVTNGSLSMAVHD
jgi:hypothetical protein